MRAKNIAELIDTLSQKPTYSPPVHIWGPPGVGKSSIPRQIAKKRKIGFVDNRAPLHDPTDYRGIPTVVEDRAVWLPPSELPTKYFCMECQRVLQKYHLVEGKCKFCKSGNITDKGILILDELTAAPPMTQAGCYQLVLDRGIGEYKLPDGWYIVAAGNRIEDRAVSYRMSSALANRFIHVEFEVNLEDWTTWAMNDGRIEPNIIGFLHFRPGLLFAFNPQSSEHSFATPRSWEFASKCIKSITSKSILAEVLEGTVGKGATAEFIAFLKVQTELPDLTPILEGKSNYVPPRTDLKYAIISALATRANPSKHFDNLVKYSDEYPEEFAVLMVSMLVAKSEESLFLSPYFQNKWSKTHFDMFKDIPVRS